MSMRPIAPARNPTIAAPIIDFSLARSVPVTWTLRRYYGWLIRAAIY